MKRKAALSALLLATVSAAVVAGLLLLVWQRISTPPAAERAAYSAERQGPLPVLWRAPDVALPAHTGETVSLRSLEGKIWIASFIFTTCTTACPMITANTMALMRRLPDPQLRFVSYSVDPEVDTLEALADYARSWNPNERRWLLLRPTPQQLPEVAKDMRVDVSPTDDPNNKVMHSSMFFLVDQRGDVRGVYDSNDANAVERLITDSQELLSEVTGPKQSPAELADAPEQQGQRLYEQLGCEGCHGDHRLAPPLFELSGASRHLEDGSSVTVDRDYVERAIVAPGTQVVAGFLKLMPSYEAHLSEPELDSLTSYLLARKRDLTASLEARTALAPSTPPGHGSRSDNLPATKPTTGTQPSEEAPPAAIVIDPVCAMKVRVTADTPTVQHAGHDYHFCSASCAKRFAASPSKFVEK